MKKYNLFLFIIMISGLFSCQSIGEAGDTVDEFYALQSQGKYDEILKIVHKKALNKYGKVFI